MMATGSGKARASGKGRKATAALLLGALVMTAGCTRVRDHRGYIVDPALVDSVAVGVDNRQSVERTLGRPTFTSQFGPQVWYYVSTDTRNLAFAGPRPTAQTILKVRFDEAGNVIAVDRAGLENVASINPDGNKTPTLGRERGFFEDLFGNIGTVGAPGTGGGGGGGGGQ